MREEEKCRVQWGTVENDALASRLTILFKRRIKIDLFLDLNLIDISCMCVNMSTHRCNFFFQ